MIRRFSSRLQSLEEHFLNHRLRNAKAYDRIAGYFSSGVLELAGEALEQVQDGVRLVCNSELDPRDVQTARAAAEAGIRREWCASHPENLSELGRERFSRLFEFLSTEHLRVRVLPNAAFGLIHGKAGVIRFPDSGATSFLGSANESVHGWKLNYELLWEDDSEEAVEWVQGEFDALWESHLAVPLSEFVIQDIGRIARRSLIHVTEDWRKDGNPASPVVESPVYRRENGLWAHQKHFVKRAFEAHRRQKEGARFLLADMVGLGKTVQLALASMLMTLEGGGPVLVLAPKALLWQWQDEIRELLDLPSAVWTSKGWTDENGILHPALGPADVKNCPRRVGIVSQGLVTAGSEVAEHLRGPRYECVIVDEAHRARRRNLGPGKEGEPAEPNNLLRFLFVIAPRAKSLLLATATPVQLHPIEVWDLLGVLAEGNEEVLGNEWSRWRQRTDEAVDMVLGKEEIGLSPEELWEWVRNPLPPNGEDRDFSIIRQSLNLDPAKAVAPGDAFDRLEAPSRQRVMRLRHRFARDFNPLIRRVVRRTRSFLENTIDQTTGEPYLKRVEVRLHGDAPNEAITLPPYLRDAYEEGRHFCESLASRVKGGGFMKTLLLRRAGSTMHAGAQTARKLLGEWQDVEEVADEEDLPASEVSDFRTLTENERGHLSRFLQLLETNLERDPKYGQVIEHLVEKAWLKEGCIVFSQYYDSVWWLAQVLSSEDLPEEPIAVYSGGARSGVLVGGTFTRTTREDLKARVRKGELRLVIGTDAASEGLNLQRLGSLINLDLPWNPTRLEQRKGRIQRIGQVRDKVHVLNLRYRDSVEDRVHELLSERLENLHSLFGQIPDVLEDAWIQVALGEIEQAKKTIDAVPRQHPFELRYQRDVEPIDWESCAEVLDPIEKRSVLSEGW